MKHFETWLDTRLEKLAEDHLYRRPRTLSPSEHGCVKLDGKSCVNFGSNDYLNFASDERIRDAVSRSISFQSWGAGASPLVTGRTTLHAELESRLAEFKQAEAALVFTSGFAANVGTISALMGRNDTIFSDAKNHASIIDGCRLSGAKIIIYPHRDTSELEALLDRTPATGRKLIVTDTLFSMDGDIAPLDAICATAKAHDAMVMVDEAHATGIFGAAGRGIAEHLECHDSIDVHVGTFSKAIGSIGGFVAGSQKLIDWLFNRARSYVFSTSPPPAMCAAAIAALDLIHEEPFRRTELLGKAQQFREILKANDWDVGDSESQIVPIILGRPDVTMQWSGLLAEHGFLVPGIRPPTVPDGESMLRVSLSYAHDDAMLDSFVQTLNGLRSKHPFTQS